MNKAEIRRKESERNWPSQIALFSLEQVNNSVQLLVACGDILRPADKADHRQWLDIRARALIAAKLATIYENNLGKSNTPYGKAKLWAELAARWMISGNDTVAHMHRARKSILQTLRVHPPSAETVLNTFQTIYNHARKNVKKGNVPIDKLLPYIRQLPPSQNQVTVQALKFASASAHAIKWSDYLVLTDDVKNQLDIIKSMPNVVIIFNKLTLQLREDWQQQWANAESGQILAFYEMIYKAHPVEESNRYIEALVGVSYSICKGPNILDKWLDSHLRRIQKKIPKFKIKDCVSIEDVHTFISGYIKSEIPIDDVYKFLKCIYSSLNRDSKKAVNLVIEQGVVQNYSHAIDFGAINVNTKYKCVPYLITNLPRVQWTKIAQVAVDLQRDPWHAIIKARTTVKEFLDLANFGKVGMSILREKFTPDFEGFIRDGILTKEEILELVERARILAVEEVEDFVTLDGIIVAPMLANIQIVFIEDQIFTRNSTSNSSISLKKDEEEQQSGVIDAIEENEEDTKQQNDIIDALQEINMPLEEIGVDTEQQDNVIDALQEISVEDEDKEEDTEQRNIDSKISLQQKVEIVKEDELIDNRLRFFTQQQEDIQQRNVNILISLQQKFQNAQLDEQKDVLEQFNKRQEDVLLQRYKKIANVWQQEEQKTHQDQLNDVLEQFQKQLEDDIQQYNINDAISLQDEFQTFQQDEMNNLAVEQFSQHQNEDIPQINFTSATSIPEKVQITESNELIVGLEEIEMFLEEQEGEQEDEQRSITSKFSLQQKIQIAQKDEVIDDLELEQSSELQEEDIQQSNTNSAFSLVQENQTAQQDELIDSLEEIGKYLKDQEEFIKEVNCDDLITLPQDELNDAQDQDRIEQCNTNSLQQQEAQPDEQNDILEQFGPIIEDIPKSIIEKASIVEAIANGRIVLGQGNLPEALQKLPDIGVEISKTQLPELYAHAMAIHQDIKAAQIICKYLNIIGRRSVFHPFVKKDKKKYRPSRFRPIPAELRNAAAVFGIKVPDDPPEDSLNDSYAKEITKAPRPVIKEFLTEIVEKSNEEHDELNEEEDELNL